MGPIELVVAIRQDHERWEVVDPASEHAHDIERRLVRPVHVLEHEHRRARLKHVPDRGQNLVRTGAALDELCECASGPGGDVCERTERAGREERITRSFEDLVGRPDRLAERPDERRLADAGLPGDDHEPAGTGPRLRQRGHELVQGSLSFEQLPASHSLAADGRRHGGIVHLEGSAAQGARG